MAEKDLPSCSDESDEDFVPEGKSSSEEDLTSDNSEEVADEANGPKSRKRRKVTKRRKKKDGSGTNEENCGEKEEKVTDVEALWADFKDDVNKMEKKMSCSQENIKDKCESNERNEKPDDGGGNIKKTNSDKTKRTAPSGTNSGKLGLSKILNQIGKKEKLSTLAKSKLDWNNFKKSEGIDEEIKTYNKGKDGYLEKQDFLQRTDLRQFEIEKQLRATRRHF